MAHKPSTKGIAPHDPPPDDPLTADGENFLIAKNLKLAAWLRLTGEKLVDRSLQPDGRVAYRFVRSKTIESAACRWMEQSDREKVLARYAGLVSHEIRKAVKLRRETLFRRQEPPEAEQGITGHDPRRSQ